MLYGKIEYDRSLVTIEIEHTVISFSSLWMPPMARGSGFPHSGVVDSQQSVRCRADWLTPTSPEDPVMRPAKLYAEPRGSQKWAQETSSCRHCSSRYVARDHFRETPHCTPETL